MRSAPAGEVRIIAGRWRGRRLPFIAVEGLRPTPDRVRETLFNWLQGVVEGSRCLDLFAGSAALGLEALSRGAAAVTWVDSDRRVTTQIRHHLQRLGGEGEVFEGDAMSFLRRPSAPFDLLFVDPPFRRNLITPIAAQLESSGWLAADAWIYVEAEIELGEPLLPPNWQLWRSKQAGQVAYRLYRRQGEALRHRLAAKDGSEAEE
jgi:16S rRNA (guanine966-N2)-methyltransferase